MCDPSTAKDIIRRIPFKVSSLVQVMKHGSYEESLVESVAQAVRQDCDLALSRLEAETGKPLS